MPRKCPLYVRVLLGFFLLVGVSGCARMGRLGGGLGATLRADLNYALHDDPGLPGSAEVEAEGLTVRRFPVVLYRPVGLARRAPALVFLPGRWAPEQQYESYARALASRGFVVAVRGRYSWFHPEEALTREALELAEWLRARPDVDPARVAIAGHSMGGRNAIRAASEGGGFSAVVAIDPGTINKLPRAAERLANLRAPLLLIGADEAWRALEFCGRRGTNYEAYFDRAPAGTLELELHGADHVQVMDAPDDFGYSVCRAGHADSRRVRMLARGATVQFLAEHLQGVRRVERRSDARGTWRVREYAQAEVVLTPEGPVAAQASRAVPAMERSAR